MLESLTTSSQNHHEKDGYKSSLTQVCGIGNSNTINGVSINYDDFKK